MLATGFRFVRAGCNRGAPWIDLGSFMRAGSSFAGILPDIVFESAGKRLLGNAADAERHR
jgi:hypothetical protein